MFKALSNPNRLRLFLRVMGCGATCTYDPSRRCCVGDLGNGSAVSPSTVSHHLKELRTAGLLRMERKGRNIECAVVPEVLGAVAGFFGKPLKR